MFYVGPVADAVWMSWTPEQARRLGETLRDLRHERDLSQEQLAYTAGITKNQMQLLERGRASGRKDSVGPSNPRISTLAGISGALGLSVSDLLARAGI